VHATLEEARKDARASFQPLLSIFPEDASRHEAALGYGAGKTFEPARIAGVARPSMFRLYLPFKLR